MSCSLARLCDGILCVVDQLMQEAANNSNAEKAKNRWLTGVAGQKSGKGEGALR